MRVFIRICAVLLLIVWAASAVRAQEATSLALKFAPGEAISYDISITGVGNLTVPGMESTAVAMQGSLGLRQSVLEVTEEGNAVLETLLPRADLTVTIKDQQAKFSYANGKVRWFTNGQEQTPPQVDLSKAPLLQSPLRITTKPDGSVTNIAFSNLEFLEMIAESVPGLPRGILGQSLPITSSSPLLPTEPVKVGETWTRTEKVPLGTGQYLDCRINRTLESVTQQGGLEIAKIVGSGETRFRGNPKVTLPGGQSFDVSIGDLRQSFGSTEFFNLGTGRLIRGDYEVRLNTNVSAAAMGQAQSAALTFRIIASVVGR